MRGMPSDETGDKNKNEVVAATPKKKRKNHSQLGADFVAPGSTLV